MARKHVALIGLCCVVMMSGVSGVFAQSRIRSVYERRLRPGRGFWVNQRTSRNIRHARDYSRSLYNYACNARKVETKVAKSESKQLGRNIDAAKKEVSTARTQTKGNQATLTALKAIEKHLDAAVKAHKALHAECCKDSVNGFVCAKHCNTISKELDKAQAEHSALIRNLELRKRRLDSHNKASSKKK